MPKSHGWQNNWLYANYSCSYINVEEKQTRIASCKNCVMLNLQFILGYGLEIWVVKSICEIVLMNNKLDSWVLINFRGKNLMSFAGSWLSLDSLGAKEISVEIFLIKKSWNSFLKKSSFKEKQKRLKTNCFQIIQKTFSTQMSERKFQKPIKNGYQNFCNGNFLFLFNFNAILW